MLATCLALFLAPVLIDLACSGQDHLFDYLASDSYYYFVVGRNIAQHGRVSFDGVLPTNGFHPLWQLVVALGFLVGRALSLADLTVLVGLVLAGALLITSALYLLGRGVARVEGRLTPFFVLLPVGVYALGVLPLWIGAAESYRVPPVYGSLWSYVNGMESAATICAFALAAYWFLTRSIYADDRSAIVQGLLLSLLALARLDTIAIGLAVLAAYALDATRTGGAPRRVGLCALSFALPLACYAVANRLYAGQVLPVSGALKSSFPDASLANEDRLWESLLAPGGQNLFRLYRLLQLLVPALLAVVALVVAGRPRSRLWRLGMRGGARLDALLCATAIGVLAISAYDFCFVELSDQGSWYTPIGTLFVSLFTVCLLGRVSTPTEDPRARRIFLAVACVGSLGFFVHDARGLGTNRAWAEFYTVGAPALRAAYGANPPRFVEIDDGIFSFATGFQSLAGKGFALDREAALALRGGHLLELAVARGFDRVTSVMYLDGSGASTALPSTTACRLIGGITSEALCKRYRYTVEYAHGDVAVIRVEEKP